MTNHELLEIAGELMDVQNSLFRLMDVQNSLFRLQNRLLDMIEEEEADGDTSDKAAK